MTRERTQIGFREMNALIDEVADVYQEIKSDVQSGNDIDQDELDELLAKVQRLIRLKFETLDELTMEGSCLFLLLSAIKLETVAQKLQAYSPFCKISPIQ